MKGPRLHRSVLSGQACRGGAENCQRAQHRMSIRQKGEVSRTILPSPANENWETIWGCLGESPASHGPWGGGVATRQNAEPLPNENQFPLPSSTLICRASELAGLTFSARSPSAGGVGCLTACPTPQNAEISPTKHLAFCQTAYPSASHLRILLSSIPGWPGASPLRSKQEAPRSICGS